MNIQYINNLVTRDDLTCKYFRSPDYNYNFNKITGFFARWGKDLDIDPEMAPSPEIADIEITTSCNGVMNNGKRKVCGFCYKSNTPKGTYMSFEKYKTIFDKLPNSVCQIAFGVDSQCLTNPDTRKIFEYTKLNGVVPNVTVADIDDETCKFLAETCGGVAVSRYVDKNICYNIVENLTRHGLKQVNIHIMLAEETKEMVWETVKDFNSDPRLKNLNAIVILSLKKKGRGEPYNIVSQDEFARIVNYSLDNNVRIGFDSCSAHKFIKSIAGHEKFQYFNVLTEPCESALFSMYINVDGRFSPCSFIDKTEGWEDGGIDISKVNDFVVDVWNNERVLEWRKSLLSKDRNCPVYSI